MNIFMTGGTGYIGRHLIAELASQHQIYALVRQKIVFLPSSINWHPINRTTLFLLSVI